MNPFIYQEDLSLIHIWIIFATKRATSTFLLSELLEKRAYGETWSLIHDGENVAFTAVEDVYKRQVLAYAQTKAARDGLRAQKSEKARAAYRQAHELSLIHIFSSK